MEILQRDQIKTFLPHREPMLLVDDVTMEGDTAIAHYHVRGDEYFLQGHFPGNPIVPGVILCEIMGQSMCILVRDELAAGRLPAAPRSTAASRKPVSASPSNPATPSRFAVVSPTVAASSSTLRPRPRSTAKPPSKASCRLL